MHKELKYFCAIIQSDWKGLTLYGCRCIVYIDSKTKILCKCKFDNHEWYARPDQLLSGNGCPKCASTKTKTRFQKTNKEFIEELKIGNLKLMESKAGEILPNIVDSKNKIIKQVKLEEIKEGLDDKKLDKLSFNTTALVCWINPSSFCFVALDIVISCPIMNIIFFSYNLLAASIQFPFS